MLILADLGPDPKHWPSEAATVADLLGGSGGRSLPRKASLVSRHRWFGTLLTRTCHILQHALVQETMGALTYSLHGDMIAGFTVQVICSFSHHYGTPIGCYSNEGMLGCCLVTLFIACDSITLGFG